MPSPSGWRTVYRMHTSGASPPEIRRAMLDEYVLGLKGLGYLYVPAPRLIATLTNHPLYFMIFASDHRTGDSIMTWCLKNVRDTRIQSSFLVYDERY